MVNTVNGNTPWHCLHDAGFYQCIVCKCCRIRKLSQEGPGDIYWANLQDMNGVIPRQRSCRLPISKSVEWDRKSQNLLDLTSHPCMSLNSGQGFNACPAKFWSCFNSTLFCHSIFLFWNWSFTVCHCVLGLCIDYLYTDLQLEICLESQKNMDLVCYIENTWTVLTLERLFLFFSGKENSYIMVARIITWLITWRLTQFIRMYLSKYIDKEYSVVVKLNYAVLIDVTVT